MSIHEVTEQDLEKLKEFFKNNNCPETTRQFNPFPLTDETAYRIAVERHIDKYFVMYSEDHKIIGLCMLRGWDEGYSIPSFGIIIDKRYRNMGLGRSLTEFIVNESKQSKIKYIRLTVNESNINAKKLYEKIGFNEIDRIPSNINNENDIKIIMIKEVN